MIPFKPTSGLSPRGVQRTAETTASLAPEREGGDSGLTRDGLRQSAGDGDVTAAPLSTQQRKSLPKGDFVFPDKAPGPGSYPIDTRSRGGNALSRSSGKPEEATVKRVVCKRYPSLPKCSGDD